MCELIKDRKFEKGFDLLGTSKFKTGINSVKTFTFGEEKPVWRIAQWGCRFPLENGKEIVNGDEYTFYDDAKSFKVYKGKGIAELICDSTKDYLSPRVQGQAWPHLLIAQDFNDNAVYVKDLKSINFNMSFTLLKMFNGMSEKDFNPALHTGQFVWFMTVQNRNTASQGFGDYFWFGMPQYDARYGVPRVFRKKDDGKKEATGKFINSIDAAKYIKDGICEGREVKFSYNALDDIIEGYYAAKRAGFLENTKFEDLAFGSMNTGLEMPGTFDLGIRINSINIEYEI